MLSLKGEVKIGKPLQALKVLVLNDAEANIADSIAAGNASVF